MRKILCLLILTLGTQVFGQEKPNYTPAPVFSDLLTNVYVRKSGEFKPGDLSAYFMTDTEGQLKVLRNGTEIAEFSFRIAPYKPPKYTIEGYSLVTGKNDVLGLMLKQSGNYELAYYAGGTKFYSFPFELVIKDNGDPYKPKKLMVLNGPWNNYAFLRKTSDESHGKWEFRVFMRSDNGDYQQTKGQVLMIRDRDQKLVAVGGTGFRREPFWRRQDFTLQKPGKKNAQGEYYSNQDLYANKDKFEDGDYTLNFTIDGKLYGAYKLTVKDGGIQPQGRQVRTTTDPLKFIEGGGRDFWLEKQ
jgi:hypothetical protein